MHALLQHRTSKARRLFGAAASLLALAAAVTLPTAPAAADTPFVTAGYSWQQGQGAVRMQPTSTYVCVLTRIGGHFQGGGEAVHVYQSAGWWYLGGHSQQQGVNGAARCFQQSAFTSVYGTAHWLSADQGLTVTTVDGCNYGSAPTWWGDAATIMTGFRGNFAGGAEAVTVTQSLNGFASSQVATGGCQDDSLYQIWSYSYFVGRPHAGNLATFLPASLDGFFKNPGTAATVPEATSAAQNGDGTVRIMARTDWAMCYLTDVHGKLRSADDYVEIVPYDLGDGITAWALHTHSGTSDGISAKARCYARNQ